MLSLVGGRGGLPRLLPSLFAFKITQFLLRLLLIYLRPNSLCCFPWLPYLQYSQFLLFRLLLIFILLLLLYALKITQIVLLPTANRMSLFSLLFPRLLLFHKCSCFPSDSLLNLMSSQKQHYKCHECRSLFHIIFNLISTKNFILDVQICDF
jgi:hypothetical protein